MARGYCLCCMLIAMKKGELDHLTRLECGREEEKCCEVILVTSQVGQAVFLASSKILKEGQAVFWFLPPIESNPIDALKGVWISAKALRLAFPSFHGSRLPVYLRSSSNLFSLPRRFF